MEKDSKKYKKAVAINYDQESGAAPRVIAKGAGEVAKNIVSLGDNCKIPIVDDDELLQLLYPLQPGEFIPQSLYTPVAKLLAYFVYFKEKKASKKNFELN